MNYKFPHIEHIDQVLPAIEGYDEFIVADRDWYKVVNYVVSKPETFLMDGPDDVNGAIRRECRGMIFDASGKIVSRPFHKFFNLGEKPETQPDLVDLARAHSLFTKMDGSMVRPLIDPSKPRHCNVRMATKMGITDVTNGADGVLYSSASGAELGAHGGLFGKDALWRRRVNWLRDMVEGGFTPIFEYVAPTNKIVIKYVDSNLVLLAVRETHSGAYVDLSTLTDVPFDLVDTHQSFSSVSELTTHTRALVGTEGYVLRFTDGHMLKIKADEYVRIHKIKDLIRTDRNILDLIVNEQIDDAIPLLDEDDTKRVRDYEVDFWKLFDSRVQYVTAVAQEMVEKHLTKKAFALSGDERDLAKYVFATFDGRNVRDMIFDYVETGVGGETKYADVMKFLKG